MIGIAGIVLSLFLLIYLAYSRVPLPIYSCIVMPNDCHFVVLPQTDTQLTEFFRWLTHTHTMRWHAQWK